jgi:hypothetical protein
VPVRVGECVLQVVDGQREEWRDGPPVLSSQAGAVEVLIVDLVEVWRGEAVVKEDEDGVDRACGLLVDAGNRVAVEEAGDGVFQLLDAFPFARFALDSFAL